MKRTQRKITQQSLALTCEQYIDESYGLGTIDVIDAAHLYARLVGFTRIDVAPGFTQFLKRSGIELPAISDLTSENIANYWEFLAHRFGLLEAADAMQALNRFWIWCSKNDHIPRQTMPIDLSGNGVLNPYQVVTKIKRSS